MNPLNVNPPNWSNTMKRFVGCCGQNCLSVFDHFVSLALKGLMAAKADSKPCETSEMSFFRKLLPATEVNSEPCKTSKIELFAKIVKN